MSFLCCVCDNSAVGGTRFCADCKIIYESVDKEPWFNELCKLMNKQRRIDNIEKYSIYDVSTKSIQSKVPRKKGRPKTSRIIKELVENIKKSNPKVSIREIEQLCITSGLSVSRETIRRMLTQK